MYDDNEAGCLVIFMIALLAVVFFMIGFMFGDHNGYNNGRYDGFEALCNYYVTEVVEPEAVGKVVHDEEAEEIYCYASYVETGDMELLTNYFVELGENK